MANKHQVIALHRDHPDWNTYQIAAAIGCVPPYVRAVAKREGLVIPHKKQDHSKEAARRMTIYALGKLAHELGLSEDDLRGAALGMRWVA